MFVNLPHERTFSVEEFVCCCRGGMFFLIHFVSSSFLFFRFKATAAAAGVAIVYKYCSTRGSPKHNLVFFCVHSLLEVLLKDNICTKYKLAHKNKRRTTEQKKKLFWMKIKKQNFKITPFGHLCAKVYKTTNRSKKKNCIRLLFLHQYETAGV